MSDLYSKLGPQGRRALLEQTGGSVGDFSIDVGSNIPQELDFLIYELRNPKSDTTISKVLSYLYNYIPYIKYEHNLRLIISAFLDSPVCFGGCDFQEIYLIIEVFKLIIDKKLRISQPSLSIKSFYDIISKTLVHFQAASPMENSWKVLPIISGIWLSNSLRNEIYVSRNFLEYKWWFRNWDDEMLKLFKRSLSYSLGRIHSNEVVYLSLISLAMVYNKEDKNIESYTQGVAPGFIISKLMEMMFLDERSSMLAHRLFYSLNPNDVNSEGIAGKEIFQKPVVKHLNKLSFLLEAYFEKLSDTPESNKLISESLFKLTQFNKQLSNSVSCSDFNVATSNKASPLSIQFWNLMKTLLFSEIIIMQGILTRFLTCSRGGFFQTRVNTLEREYRGDISFKILTNLYHVNFILLSIGQGGFDNYNFVYYLSLELSNTNMEYFQQFSKRLMFDYTEVNLYPDVLNSNYIMNSKVLFVLGLWENYFQQVNRPDVLFTNEIYETCLNLVDVKYNKELLESSHSVLLFYFSKTDNTNLVQSIDYVNLLISQFPHKLSAHQLNIAIETIGKRLMSSTDLSQDLFNLLVTKSGQTQPGVRIDNKEQQSPRTSPETVRETLILSLIQLIPYFPVSKLIPWLDEIWLLIVRSNKLEGQFLELKLWNCIGENLDLNRSELAIRWWYNEKELTKSFWSNSKM
ncbi:Peroxisomal biogenesis factor 8 [Spathaspora sp. JA1]|nr:Peroxisomal biogenesis factor 8 [Spathaspora sp. JA1]